MRGYRGDEDEGEDEDERTNRWTDRKMIRGSLVLYVTSVIRCVGVCVSTGRILLDPSDCDNKY